MDDNLKTKNDLSPERMNVIAHAIAEHFLQEQFRLMPNGDYRRRLGQAVKQYDNGITAEELHQFIVGKTPKLIGRMFGWSRCDVRGSHGH